MKRVGVCGHFGEGLNLLNGQTIKTKIVTNEIKRQIGETNVAIVDTHGGIKRLGVICVEMFRLFQECKNIIIAPAHNGLKVFVPMCVIYNMIFRRKIHYLVIGGWIDSYIESHKVIKRMLHDFTSICVETTTMKKALELKGYSNIVIMPNCKKLEIIEESKVQEQYSEPYHLCTFSRVMKEKGIEDIICAVEQINEEAGRTIYTLDIYGEIWGTYVEEFAELQKRFPSYIKYKGKVDFDKSVSVLCQYFLLVFPTKFFTEGIPGTIIDAYAAGLPVLASKWESYHDVIDDDVTGIGYEFGNTEELEKLLIEIMKKPNLVIEKKKKCLKKAREYMPDQVVGSFIEKNLEE